MHEKQKFHKVENIKNSLRSLVNKKFQKQKHSYQKKKDVTKTLEMSVISEKEEEESLEEV